MTLTIVDEARAITGGVDTHADTHMAAALDPIGGLLGVQEFPATPAGYGRLLAWLQGFGAVHLAGIEGTGSYGAGLARHLAAGALISPGAMPVAQADTLVLVATGTVSDTSGTAVPGAIVALYAWPSDAVLDGLTAGQRVPETQLATTTAGSTGAYSLYVPQATLQAAATVANLEVDSGDSVYFFSVDTAPGATDPGGTPIAPMPQTADMGNASEATTPDICLPWVYQKQMNRDWATVGSTYIWNASQGVTGHFSYQKSQNSSLGIAFKATVSATPVPSAGFSADGTRTDNSQTTVGYPNRGTGYNIEYQTQWRTAPYQQQCTGGIPKPIHWHVRENSWIGGQKLITETSPPSTANGICAQYLPGTGSSFNTGSEQAIKWTASLGLAMGDISFEATSQTGYDTNAQITYGFANATHVNYVCGTNTVPSNAWRVVVQSHENP